MEEIPQTKTAKAVLTTTAHVNKIKSLVDAIKNDRQNSINIRKI